MESAIILTAIGLVLLVLLTVWITRATHVRAPAVILVGYLGVFLLSAGLASFGLAKHDDVEKQDGKNIHCAVEAPRLPDCPPVNQS